MGVRDQLGTDKRTISLEMGLLFRKLIQVVGVILDIPIGRNETPPWTSGGILYDFSGLRLDYPHDAIDQPSRREVLARAGFLVLGVFLQQTFVEVAQTFLARAENQSS